MNGLSIAEQTRNRTGGEPGTAWTVGRYNLTEQTPVGSRGFRSQFSREFCGTTGVWRRARLQNKTAEFDLRYKDIDRAKAGLATGRYLYDYAAPRFYSFASKADCALPHFSLAPEVLKKNKNHGKMSPVVTTQMKDLVPRYGDVAGYMYQKGKHGGTFLQKLVKHDRQTQAQFDTWDKIKTWFKDHKDECPTVEISHLKVGAEFGARKVGNFLYLGLTVHCVAENLADQLMDMRLSVYSANDKGNKLYKKLGFTDIANWPSRLHFWPVGTHYLMQ